MIINNLKIKNENINENVDVITYTNKDVNNSNSNDIVILQNNDRLIITILTFFFFKILENDNKVTLKEKK